MKPAKGKGKAAADREYEAAKQRQRIEVAQANHEHCTRELAEPTPALAYVKRSTWENLQRHWRNWLVRMGAWKEPPA